MAMTPSAIRDLSILVIEDNAISRQLVEFLLKALGCSSVTCAEDGDEALKIMSGGGKPPDVFLCDGQMPNMSGLEFLTAIRAKGYDGTFIMVTAVNSLEAAALAKTHGADGYLIKPVTKDGLLKTIEATRARVSPSPALPG